MRGEWAFVVCRGPACAPEEERAQEVETKRDVLVIVLFLKLFLGDGGAALCADEEEAAVGGGRKLGRGHDAGRCVLRLEKEVHTCSSYKLRQAHASSRHRAGELPPPSHFLL